MLPPAGGEGVWLGAGALPKALGRGVWSMVGSGGLNMYGRIPEAWVSELAETVESCIAGEFSLKLHHSGSDLDGALLCRTMRNCCRKSVGASNYAY